MPGYSLRRRARRDTSEAAIKAVLEAAGWTVQPLSLRDGPDLLVGAYGWFTGLAEIKTARGKVKPGQAHWHMKWRGVPVRVLRTPEDALAWVREVADAPQILSDAQELMWRSDDRTPDECIAELEALLTAAGQEGADPSPQSTEDKTTGLLGSAASGNPTDPPSTPEDRNN